LWWFWRFWRSRLEATDKMLQFHPDRVNPEGALGLSARAVKL
jgi:hypothetical protein